MLLNLRSIDPNYMRRFLRGAQHEAVPDGRNHSGDLRAGQMFFLTTAPARSDLFGCAASNIWTLDGGGSGGRLTSHLGDFSGNPKQPHHTGDWARL